MLMYPDPFKGYDLEWIEELRQFQDKSDVIRLEKKDVFDYLKNPSLVAFYNRIEELSKLPSSPDYPPMPEDAWTWLYIIPKKQHEIRKLAPHIDHLYRQKLIEKIVDIGGGIGLLAQTLNNQYKHKVVTVDLNEEFQKTGQKRHEVNARDKTNKVQYTRMRVESGPEFFKLLDGQVMPIGLHTCGKLALDQIRAGAEKQVPAIVNFGCCYLTLDKTPDLQNISRFAQAHDPLWMNLFALTLSCRAHRKMSEKDYDLKLKVKFYRYAFHILLHDHYGISDLVNLGNSSPKLYNENFSVYAQEQFKRIGLTPQHSDLELDAFFNNPELTITIQKMLAAGLIRNALGRVLEVYLLLDRAIYLEEMGYYVRVEEFFDEELSPRNIGITAIRK